MESILIIDDDIAMRRALRLTLEKSGYAVLEAGDGNAGLGIFRQQRIDLVITDLIMPGMEGLETIRGLVKLNPNIRILAMSGGGRGSSTEYLEIARQFGAVQVFEKPFDFRTMCTVVSSILRPEAGAGA